MMTRNVVCLKWGEKYSPHYVNVLYNMVKRHSSLTDNFICLTDDPTGINDDVDIRILPTNLPIKGWWFKPYIYSRDNGIDGDILFMDLDVIIFNNMDKLWTHDLENAMFIRDFNRKINPSCTKFNSSVFRIPGKTLNWVWEDFINDHERITSRMPGDQDYMYQKLKDHAQLWPDNWIQSYKWEMRDKSELSLINGKRNFINVREPNIDPECFVAVFHGDPKPDAIHDRWVIDNWK